jgi:hypothetical protein
VFKSSDGKRGLFMANPRTGQTESKKKAINFVPGAKKKEKISLS